MRLFTRSAVDGFARFLKLLALSTLPTRLIPAETLSLHCEVKGQLQNYSFELMVKQFLAQWKMLTVECFNVNSCHRAELHSYQPLGATVSAGVQKKCGKFERDADASGTRSV